MSLWLWYCPGSDVQIRTACEAAQAELDRRGVSGWGAQQANFDAADLDESYSEEATPEADAIVAWYVAEEIAFKSIFEQVGEWPHQATLIHVQGDSA